MGGFGERAGWDAGAGHVDGGAEGVCRVGVGVEAARGTVHGVRVVWIRTHMYVVGIDI